MSLRVETDAPHHDGVHYLDVRDEKLTTGISFLFLLALLVLTGSLHLGMVLLSSLFASFALNKLNFVKRFGKWFPVVIFLTVVGGAAYGVAYFVQATAAALPGIAEKSIPAVTQWAGAHHIRLPFTDLNSLKEQASKIAASSAKDFGKFADVAAGATTEFIYLIVGIVVAIGIFLNPCLQVSHEPGERKNTLYSLCRDKICHRVNTFYESFAMVMSAQVIISAIDTTLTGIFVATLHLPYLVVAVGVTFICGLVPVVGNLASNTLVMALGFMVSPAKGLGALAFLVGIHQLEYFLNSKIIGGKIKTPLWLTFLALVVGESLMGITGMIIAPAVLHYIRIESSRVSFQHERPRLKHRILAQPHRRH